MTRRYLTTGLLIALAVNLVLAGLYVWSRDGQRTVVSVEAREGHYRVTTDGRQPLPHWLPEGEGVFVESPAAGTVRIILPREVSSLPRPSGIESVVITAADGAVLFRDDFETLDLDVWEVLSGGFEVNRGVLSPTTLASNQIQLRDFDAGSYTVSVTYRNSRGGTIGTHLDEAGGVYYHFELIRDFPNFLDAFHEGERSATLFGGFVRTSGSESVKSFAHMLTRPYPYVLAALLAGVLLALLVAQADRVVARARQSFEGASVARWPWALIAVGVVAAGAFAVTLGLNWRYYGFLPHVPDEVSYMFQAHLLASGRIMIEMPPVHEAFYFYFPPFLYERDGLWGSPYPFGHPVALAVGALFGAIWLIPSLIGAGSIALTYGIGRKLYNARTGLVAAALLAMSPFFLMQSSNFMSHNTGAFYILASLFFIIHRDKPLLYGLLAGLFFGLAANTRTLNTVALILPFGVLMLSYLLTRETRSAWAKHTGTFLGGALLMGAAMLAYNYGLTGDPFGSTYAQGDTSQLLGFSEGHTVDIGLRNQQAQMMALVLVLHGWPAFVGLAFVLLPFLLGTRNRWDWFLLACVLLPTGVYILYRFSGLFGGPRYWYEATPFLMLLSARGAELAASLLADAAVRLRERLRWGFRRSSWAGAVPVYAVLAVLAVYGSAGWLFGWHEAQDSPQVPYRAAAIDGLFGVDDRLDRLARRTELDNALVLVEPCGFFRSVACYGTVFLRNLPDFDGPVIWARYIEGGNQEIIEAFPGRDVYVATWDGGASLRPFDPENDQ